jgi:hypothetical protein
MIPMLRARRTASCGQAGHPDSPDMLNICDVWEAAPAIRRMLPAGGTRTALRPDGFMMETSATTYRSAEWLEQRADLGPECAPTSPAVKHQTMRRIHMVVGSRML